MFRKFRSHMLLALIFTFMTLLQQYLFYYVKGFPIVWFTPGKYLGIYAFLLAATFIRPFGLRYLFLSFVFLLNFSQMAHLSYFGTQILPNEFFLIMTQMHEIQGTLGVEYHHVLIPFIFTLIPALVGWYSLKKLNDLYTTNVMGILFILYLIYNPARTLMTGNTWGRQPSTRELTGMNVYLSFSYFMGKILPSKITRGRTTNVANSSTILLLTKGADPIWDKVVIVLGESLSPAHMSLFGYERKTTPFLDSQIDDPNFFHTIGLSGGVSTDISVAFFLNMGFGEAGSLKASRGDNCLFKLAKDKSYQTYFFSIQSSEQLRYIAPYLCASSLDDYKSLEEIAPETEDHQAARDRDLIRYVRKIVDFDTKQFIILHQRGSHGPWELRSSPEARIFPHDDKVNHYDNSVVEFDLFMRDLFDLFNSSKKKVLMIYVSDHGEALGEDGKWGHGQLIRPSFEVPVIIKTFNQDLPKNTLSIPRYIPHYNLSLYIAQALGYKPSQDPLTPVQDYVIFGNDIDGFAGKANILFGTDGTYDFKVSE